MHSYPRNIRIIYLVNLLKGLIFFLPIYALYLQSELFTAFNVTMIIAIQAIARLIFEVPSGAIADLFGRKNTLIASGLISILAISALASASGMIMFVVYAILNALSEALLSGTDTAILFDSLKQENDDSNFKKVISWNIGMWQIGATISSALGGFLAVISLKLPIYLTLIPFSIALILTLFIIEPKYEKEKYKKITRHVLNSFDTIIHNRQLLLLGILTVLIFAFSETTHAFDPIFYTYKNISLGYMGLISATGFILSFLGSIVAAHHFSPRLGDKKVLLMSTLGHASLLLAVTFLVGIWAAIAIVIGSFFWGMRLPIITDMFNKNADSSKRATIISIGSFASLLGLALYAPLFGKISDSYNINLAMQVSAILPLSCVILVLYIKE